MGTLGRRAHFMNSLYECTAVHSFLQKVVFVVSHNLFKSKMKFHYLFRYLCEALHSFFFQQCAVKYFKKLYCTRIMKYAGVKSRS